MTHFIQGSQSQILMLHTPLHTHMGPKDVLAPWHYPGHIFLGAPEWATIPSTSNFVHFLWPSGSSFSDSTWPEGRISIFLSERTSGATQVSMPKRLQESDIRWTVVDTVLLKTAQRTGCLGASHHRVSSRSLAFDQYLLNCQVPHVSLPYTNSSLHHKGEVDIRGSDPVHVWVIAGTRCFVRTQSARLQNERNYNPRAEAGLTSNFAASPGYRGRSLSRRHKGSEFQERICPEMIKVLVKYDMIEAQGSLPS